MLGASFFCCRRYCSPYDALLLRKSFYCVCCHFLVFYKGVVRQQVIRLKRVTGVTANLKWILKCFLGKFLFDAFMRQLSEYAAERDVVKEDV